MTARDVSISQVLQDTFAGLQEQLDEERRHLLSDPRTPAEERNLEELIAELAVREGFEVSTLLGAGGMGAVVRATDLKLKRTVALKFLPPEILSDPANAKELRQEAELASRIAHENVVQILSWHEVDHVPFFAMEFIEGETAYALVKRRGRLPVMEALRIASEAAAGLEALHENGIIHRDIKPQNIMISREGRVKITDFGISRTQDMISVESSRKSYIAGTPKFMAPEQARGEAATKRSDIYSLGATLYFLLTGKPPVETSADFKEQLRNVREGRLVPIGSVLPKLNRQVATVVARAISPRPSKRPLDVASFRQELDQAFLAVTMTQRSWLSNLVYRYRHGGMAVATLVLGLVAGFSLGHRSSTSQLANAASPADGYLREVAMRHLSHLDEIGADRTSDTELAAIHTQLRALVLGDSNTGLAEKLAPLERRMRDWERRRLLEREAADPNSPVHSLAVRALSEINSEPARTSDILAQWHRLWILETSEAP